MVQVLAVVIPVFALILVGYGVGRLGWISENGGKGLAEFTFQLAIPVMLFRQMATAELPEVTPYALWGAYYGTATIIWLAATLMTAAVLRRPAPDAASICMSASFGNVVMIGMPLALNLYGESAAAAVAILVSAHSPLLWAGAAVHLSLTRNRSGSAAWSILTGLWRELSRNVIILAIFAGTLWRFTGLGLHPIADDIIVLLGRAGIPCALVSLGLSLVTLRIAGQVPTLTTILALKLVAMPLVAWFVATEVFALPPVPAGIITIFASMPTGANAYLFATRNGLAQHSASGAVALGTFVAAFTAAVVVYLLSPG
jgi:malonate transporter and related proteins